MKLLSRLSITYGVLILIVALGLFLRSHNYAVWPREGATFDEYAWTWLGMSLLETGVPTSWSPHKQYDTRVHFQNTKGASFFLVTPYLEHPPLFGLVAGGYAKAIGLKEFNDVGIEKIRPLALLLGLVSIVAVFLLVSEMTSRSVGIGAAFLYAITPSVVVGSRLVQNENFFIPMFLLALYFAVKFINTNNKVFILVSIVICSLLPLAKIPWIAAPGAVFALLLAHKKYKHALLLLSSTIGCFLIFLLYGFRLDSQLFINLWTLQLNRYDMNFDTIFSLFRDPIITDRLFLDGFIYLGFISFGVIATLKKKEYLPILLGFLSYFFIFLFAIPNEPGHGWYRYPLYPFFIIMNALLIKEYFNKNMIISSICLLIPGLAALYMSWQQVFGFSSGIYRIFLLCSVFGILTLIFPQERLLKVAKLINILLLIIVGGLVIWSGYLYTEQ